MEEDDRVGVFEGGDCRTIGEYISAIVLLKKGTVGGKRTGDVQIESVRIGSNGRDKEVN